MTYCQEAIASMAVFCLSRPMTTASQVNMNSTTPFIFGGDLSTRGYPARVCLTVYPAIAKIRAPISKHRRAQCCMFSDKAIRRIFWYCSRAPGVYRCDLQHLQERDFTLCIIGHAHLGCCYGQRSGRRNCEEFFQHLLPITSIARVEHNLVR